MKKLTIVLLAGLGLSGCVAVPYGPSPYGGQVYGPAVVTPAIGFGYYGGRGYNGDRGYYGGRGYYGHGWRG